MSFSDVFETVILVTALSVDAFIASLSYGGRGIKIPVRSVLVLSGVCSGILTLTAGLGRLLSPLMSSGVSKAVCFAVLFIMGFIRVFDSTLKAWIKSSSGRRRVRFSAFNLQFLLEIYADPKIADLDSGGVLSSGEAALLAAALSLDGGAAGFGAGAGDLPILLTALLSFAMGILTVVAGVRIGRAIARHTTFDLSPIGGILLIVLAFLKL